jgi:trk system potassium uptake protein TrkA
MRIIVVGAGEVGYHLAMRLSEDHDVVVIEHNAELAGRIQSQLDVLVVEGNGASLAILEKAGIENTDLLLAVTNFDEANLIACLIASQFNVGLKVARVSNPEYYEREVVFGAEKTGADLLINPEKECAREILNHLLRSEAREVVEFADGRIVLLGLSVEAGAPAAGLTLSEIGERVVGDHFLTLAIDRNGTSIIPDGSTKLLPGDDIYLLAETPYLADAYRFLGLERKQVRHVMLLGGGRVGTSLAQLLETEGVQVTIIERSRARCVKLAELLNSALVLHGDATDLDLLAQEGVADTDGLVSITSEDETNLLASLLTKDMGARKVITLLKRSEYIPLVTKVGVDSAVSPRLSTANRILQYVRGGKILSMAVMERNQSEAMEIEIEHGSRAAGRRVRDLDLPDGAILGSVEREGEIMIPRGDTEIQVGDRVVVFALPKAIGQTADFFD